MDRIRAAFSLFDIIRLDHFRGFESYWEIPAGATDAREGKWRKGPGLDFFRAVRGAIPGARIIAEDLGYIGPDVVALRRAAGLPGMKILQFAYGHDASNVNLPHFYAPDSVAYTGTHDNNTTRGWLEGLSIGTAEQVREYFQLNGSSSAWPMIRVALATASRLAIVPIQDLLDLPAASALNQPGTAEGNWQWRYTDEQMERLVAEKLETLRHWIKLYDRTGAATLKDYSEPPPKPRGHQ
jgi:4-alpha-glucanotransferase